MGKCQTTIKCNRHGFASVVDDKQLHNAFPPPTNIMFGAVRYATQQQRVNDGNILNLHIYTKINTICNM